MFPWQRSQGSNPRDSWRNGSNKTTIEEKNERQLIWGTHGWKNPCAQYHHVARWCVTSMVDDIHPKRKWIASPTQHFKVERKIWGHALTGRTKSSFHVVLLRTDVFRKKIRMSSVLSSSAVLTTCYLLLDSRPFGPTLRPILSFVATGIPGHAGGWHLCRKPCVVLFPCLFPCPASFLSFYARSFRQHSRNVSSRDVEMWRP